MASTLVDEHRLVAPDGRPPRSTLSDAGRFLAGRLRQIGIFLALLVIVTLFQVLTGGALLQPDNVSNIVVQNSYILLLAIGMVMIIVAGHIDLSVGSVAAFVGAMSGIMIRDWSLPWWVALVASLAVGALVGAWQGFWVAYVGIPAFIVTLAGMLVFRGLTQIVLENQRITGFPQEYRQLGGGFLFPGLFPPETSILDWTTVGLGVLATVLLVGGQVRGRRTRARLGLDDEPRAWFVTKLVFAAVVVLGLTYLLASSRSGTPIVLVVLGVLVVAYSTVMKRSVFGRHVYARGGNLQAAQLSGVDTKRVDFLLFVNMGVLAALAGLIFTGRQPLRARRDRRRVHRRCRRHRRSGNDRRGHHRRTDHGRAQQRHVPDGRRHRLPAVHQGHGAAPGGRLRRAQQAPRHERAQVSRGRAPEPWAGGLAAGPELW
jgi:putative multiple sugar transport system permease protein